MMQQFTDVDGRALYVDPAQIVAIGPAEPAGDRAATPVRVVYLRSGAEVRLEDTPALLHVALGAHDIAGEGSASWRGIVAGVAQALGATSTVSLDLARLLPDRVRRLVDEHQRLRDAAAEAAASLTKGLP